jgi:hypothetical protein
VSTASTPWTVGACAAFMGFDSAFVRRAIVRGVTSGRRRRRVQLEAEVTVIGGRRRYRVHLDHFVKFLQQIGWQRLPTAADGPLAARFAFASTRRGEAPAR